MDTVTAKLPAELNLRLEKLAAQTDRKKSYLIRKAIEEYLEDMEDYLIAKARMAKQGKRLTLEEVERDLGLDA